MAKSDIHAEVTAEGGKYYWAHPDTANGAKQGPFNEPLLAAEAAQVAGYLVGPWDLDDESADEADREIDEHPDLIDELNAGNAALR